MSRYPSCVLDTWVENQWRTKESSTGAGAQEAHGLSEGSPSTKDDRRTDPATLDKMTVDQRRTLLDELYRAGDEELENAYKAK